MSTQQNLGLELQERLQEEPPAQECSGGSPRLRKAERHQVEILWASLDQLLEPEHPARAVWEAVNQCDLQCLLRGIRAVEGEVGRNATDPRILLALWVYATLQGVASARSLAKLCVDHVAYRWICGRVSVNYHLLADFRSQNETAFEELLTQLVAGLLHSGFVTMHRVAQDGMRVRASAGRSSFRRQETIEKHLEEARQQVQSLKRVANEEASSLSSRQQAARERAALERQQRLEEALKQVQEVERMRAKWGTKRSQAQRQRARSAVASETDSEARLIKFADGGTRPGYNVQFATDTASSIITGVAVTNQGSDQGLLLPMLEQHHERYRRRPEEALVDGGYVKLEDIVTAQEHNCLVYAPIPNERKKLKAGLDPYAPEKRDTPAVTAWRKRMSTEEGKVTYKLRAQTAEWINAQCRNRNLRSFPVRGLVRCRGIALLYALAHNLMQALKLKAAAVT